MDQYILYNIARIILGPTGRRLPAYDNIEAAFTLGLFKDYYAYNKTLSRKTYYKYLNQSTPFPHFWQNHYGAKSSDYRRSLSDMRELVDNCPSITLLYQIQNEIYQWTMANLPMDEAEKVCKNHVAQNATRQDIAVFLADMLHYAIIRDPVANRPTKSGELV